MRRLNPFRKFPIATLVVFGAAMLAALTVVQSSGVLTGTAAHWVDLAAGLLQVFLTAYARQHATPVANPRDNAGRKLVPAPGQMLVPPQQ